ncbi:MAG: MBL fold metallo-hydrolase [Acidovorax sp.]|uniref:MBL fold metallo-hydrolase n=1 Tax=Acidovorax sp. TaxID=1872122 RepID=UPI00391C2704
MFKRALLAVLALLLLALAALWWALQQHPSLAPYADLHWKAPVGSGPPAPLKVTFLGVSTVLLDDGETALLTDGFFSRPGKLQTFLGKVEPDLQAIAQGLERAGLTGKTGRLAAVIPVHSHYDHAMDAPEVARRTGALLLGSPSTANVGRGAGLPEAQIHTAKLGEPLRFGRFTATLYPAGMRPPALPAARSRSPCTRPCVPATTRKAKAMRCTSNMGARPCSSWAARALSPGPCGACTPTW